MPDKDSTWTQWRLFILAVIKHWGWLVSGVVVTVATYGWGQFRHWFTDSGPDIPPRVFYLVGFLLIFVACFLAWRDEHNARLIAQGKLDTRADRKRIREALGRFIELGRGYQGLYEVASEQTVIEWEEEIRNYCANEPLLGLEYSAQVTVGATIPITIPSNLTGKDRDTWCRCHTVLAQLKKFINDLKDEPERG